MLYNSDCPYVFICWMLGVAADKTMKWCCMVHIFDDIYLHCQYLLLCYGSVNFAYCVCHPVHCVNASTILVSFLKYFLIGCCIVHNYSICNYVLMFSAKFDDGCRDPSGLSGYGFPELIFTSHLLKIVIEVKALVQQLS